MRFKHRNGLYTIPLWMAWSGVDFQWSVENMRDERLGTNGHSHDARAPAGRQGDYHRSKVLATLKENPGLNIDELAETVGLSRSTTRYHVRRLTNAVVRIRQGHHVLLFSSDLPRRRCEALALLRVASIRYVVGRLMDHSRITPKEFAGEVGMSARSVRRSIHKLVQEEMAKEQRVEDSRGAKNSVREVALHPEMRVAWALWCKESDEEVPLSPLHRSMGVWFMIDSLFGKLFVMWQSYRDDMG